MWKSSVVTATESSRETTRWYRLHLLYRSLPRCVLISSGVDVPCRPAMSPPQTQQCCRSKHTASNVANLSSMTDCRLMTIDSWL